MHEYRWPALDLGEIRLLNLYAGDSHEELVGNLKVIKLMSDDVHHYDTLSYTWGDHDPTELIKIIQDNQQYYIRIRPNLHSALQHLRSHRENRYLWVDAVCINQSDEEEKSGQVRMMFDIFNNSTSVCVWVGPEGDDSRMAIDFIKTHLVCENADQLFEDPKYRYEWLALAKLMRRPWFRRRWIIQEIALAKNATLHCGGSWLYWDDFADAVMLFAWGHNMIRSSWDWHHNLLGDIRESAATRLVQSRDKIFRKSEDGQILDKMMSLEALLCSFSAFDASNPQDTIYAILAIAQDAKPGFSGSITIAESEAGGFQDPEFNAEIFEPPGSYYPTPESESGVSLQSMSLKKRAYLNIPTDKEDEHNERQHKRVQTNGFSNTLNPEEPRPAATPDIRVFTTNNDVDHPPPRVTTDGDRENFPVAPTGSVSPISQGDEDTLSPYQGKIHADAPNTINRRASLDTRMIGRLQVPHRGRGNSSASLSSNQTEKYLKQSEDERKRQAEPCQIPVDYSKPVQEVCKDVMKYAFEKTKSLNMICRPWAPKADDLPSWIMPVTKSAFGLAYNGTYTRINADPLVGQPGYKLFYNATPNLFGRWNIDRGGKDILTVHGFVLDEIRQKAPPANAGVIPIEWNELARWEDTSELPPESFWRTLVGNRDQDGQQPLKIWRRACKIAFSMKPQGGPLNIEKILEVASPLVKEYLEMVLCATYSRRLSISSRGLWALVPAKSKKGDKLCIINGCSVPIVLRAHEAGCNFQGECNCRKNNNSEERIYEMIGESYIHSMMDGEALLYQQKNGIKERAFKIR
ncbi:heterokaryon incompatibility protein-domain-containing protein [Talaromyces proteolyticus]|uniref:Heterokaryon incompatibility protein-domain-containing protein n=1 Tax=Talaromyces proteolyticus TaxID=1131652 RepID=A0AAD4PXY5_9EURO|nr:heterokaryon incompatibility protein-domain-containing protein [Talaromyces proteolyticus]KAH8693273.1 heterokaryon incompatibility protein-domain-containing protein [Talaromyces proteolyticus]